MFIIYHLTSSQSSFRLIEALVDNPSIATAAHAEVYHALALLHDNYAAVFASNLLRQYDDRATKGALKEVHPLYFLARAAVALRSSDPPGAVMREAADSALAVFRLHEAALAKWQSLYNSYGGDVLDVSREQNNYANANSNLSASLVSSVSPSSSLTFSERWNKTRHMLSMDPGKYAAMDELSKLVGKA